MSVAPAGLAERLHAEVVRGGVGDERETRWRIAEAARREAPLLDAAELAAVIDRVAARTFGLGPLDALLADPLVTEVMVNGPGPVWIEREGRLERTDLVLDRSDAELLVERVVGPLGLRADRTSPLVDARLADGSRVNAAMPPLAIDGPYVTIRRFVASGVGLDALCSGEVADLLAWAVRSRCNIVVSGGTGAGKTTLLNALASCIDGGERVVTVEDAAELRLPLEHVVRLEARPANAEGIGEALVRDLVRNALRMRPDRIVVGECRGAEAIDMLQAMNSGHEGSITTCHANAPVDALRRLETMVLMGDVSLPLAAIREQIASSVDLVVHVARRPDGARRVVAVDEVVPRAVDEGARPLRTRCLATGERVEHGPARPTRSGEDWVA